MEKASESSFVLLFIFLLFCLSFLDSKPKVQNKGVLNTIQPVYYVPHQPEKPEIQEESKVVKDEFASDLFLPPKLEQNDISIEKPEVDMREMSIDTWRKDTETKNNKVILNDLRSYQDEYNNLEKNNFKTMSIDEHNQQNIKEWEQRVREHTNGQINNI